MKTRLLALVVLSSCVSVQAQDAISIPRSFLRYGGNFPLDSTAVWTNYEDAVAYAAGGGKEGIEKTSAYKGQYISVPSNGVYYIDNNWNLREIGGSIQFRAGNPNGTYTPVSSDTLFVAAANDTSDNDMTWIEYIDGVPVLWVPSRGQKGADGSNLSFAGEWNEANSYDPDNLVSYEGEAFVCRQSVTGISPTNDAYWELVVSRGRTGDTGPTGETGAIGPQGPVGLPGLGLVYLGAWTNGMTCRSNSVVRHGTNLWYTVNENSTEPGLSDTWEVFLNDGRQGIQGKTGNTGSTGPQGPPGNTFGIYAGAWNPNTTYSSNMWVTWSGGTYGILSNLTPTPGTAPTNYPGEIIVLSVSGRNGVDGRDGAGLIPCGTWDRTHEYHLHDMVRYGDAQYHCIVSASIGEAPVDFPSRWELFVKDGANISDAFITTNAFWSGKLENRNYCSNSIVYWDAVGYGVYYVVQDLTAGNFGAIPTCLGNTNYFRKIANYGRDGNNGATGAAGRDGKNGADGIGNIWYAGYWDTREYGTNYMVTYSNAQHGVAMYLSTAPSQNVKPGVTSGWQNYWTLMLRSGSNGKDGANGSAYKFLLGWDRNTHYDQYDVCVVSNNFYVCSQAGGSTGEEPWIYTGRWTKLISPDYRFYPLAASRVYDPNDTYENDELVRDGQGSTYVVIDGPVSHIAPGSDTNKFAVFAGKGDKGDKGNTGDVITPVVLATIPLDAGEDAYVSNTVVGTASYMTFGLPKGDRGMPGANLVYYGDWEATNTYAADSLVRSGTNLWCSLSETTNPPSGESSDWIVFLSDGPAGTNASISIDGIDTGNPGTDAEVTAVTNGSHVTLRFKIPRGNVGARGAEGPIGRTGIDYYGAWSAMAYSSNALVRHGTNLWYAADGALASDVPAESAAWVVFLSDGPVGATGETGPIGPAIYPVATNTTTLPPGSQAYVYNTISGTNVFLDFGIPQGIQGPAGATLVPRGTYSPNVEYQPNDLVRYTNAQYYVSSSSAVSNVAPTNTEFWSIFLEDGKGIAANATLIVEEEVQHPGVLNLDTNTLTVVSSNSASYLTVVGGPGGGVREPIIETPDGRKWKAVGVYTDSGVPTHAWVEFLGSHDSEIILDMPDNRHFRMVGAYVNGNTNMITHAWEEIHE